jgi:tetratricopeptide (TPR) repeat protein
MADVFLSYTLQDRDVAQQLVDRLRRADVSVFWGDDSIRAGDSVTDVVSRALAQAKVFVLVDQGQAGQSEFVRREIDAAISRGMAGGLVLLPVLLPGRKPTGDLSAFRYIRVGSDGDLSPVVDVVLKLLYSAPRPRPTADHLRLSFLAGLLRTDLMNAPVAASLVLDEISQSVGLEADDVDGQLGILRDALAWGRTNLGLDHPAVSTLMYRLTDMLFRLRRFAEAAEMSREILHSSKRPVDIVLARLNLANALIAMGDARGAEKQYQQALSEAQTLDLSSATATALVALGTLARQRGDTIRARKLYEDAVRVTTSLSHPSARVDALIGLCEVLRELGDNEALAKYAEEALWLAQTTLGADHALALRAAAAGAKVPGK